MPFLASSVQGLPDARTAGPAEPGAPVSWSDDGARPSTAAVCRHLLGDVFEVTDREWSALENAVAS